MTIQEFAEYWDDLKSPKVATDIATITEWKGDIEKLCNETNSCSTSVQQKVNALYGKITAIHSAIQGAPNVMEHKN